MEGTKADFTGQAVYVGLDVHKRCWVATILTEHVEHKTFTQPPRPHVLVQYLERNFPGGRYYCLYEAGYCGFWIHEALRRARVQCFVVNPADVATTDKEKRQKTNRVDSRKLGRVLRNGDFVPLYVPSRSALEDRTLVRTRHALVSKQTRCKNQIKGLLSFYGIMVPDDIVSRHWSRRYIAWIEQLEMTRVSGNEALKVLLQELMHLRTSIVYITKLIRGLALEPEYRERADQLIGIGGISTLTAMTLLTELVEISRFHSLDHLASYCGLVPGEHSSGDEQTMLEITPRKNSYLRSVLIESSWVAVRYDPVLLASYECLRRRMGAQRAIVRIAHKLLNRIRFVLKNRQPYITA